MASKRTTKYWIDNIPAFLNPFLCVDCKVNTSPHANMPDGICEYYMVNFDLWNKHGAGEGMLCVGCLESRMGRRLTKEDFLDAPVNKGCFPYSDRLKERLNGL